MDIRRFFGSPGKPKPSGDSSKPSSSTSRNGKGKRKHADDDDDFVSAEKKQRHITKPTKMKKSNIIYDDSDSDEGPQKKSAGKQNGGKPTPKKPSKLPAPSPPKAKPTTVIDFFGSSPVQRSAKKNTAAKREQTHVRDGAKKARLELEEHEDEDFQKTLRMLDEETSRERDEKHAKPKGLASKLAAKVKAEHTVPETPERDKPREKQRPRETVVKDTPSSDKHHSRIPKKADEKPSLSRRDTTPSKSSAKTTPSKTPPKVSPPAMKREATVSPPSLEGEKKRGNPSYRSYLTREGPRSLGSREEPKGEEGCLDGLTFVVTGVLEFFDKDEVKGFVEKHGGRVTGSVSKKTTHLVVGREPGESKVAKAQEFGTKQIQEEDLFEMIETRPGRGKGKVKGQASPQPLKKEASKSHKPAPETHSRHQETVVKKEPTASKQASTSTPSTSSSHSTGQRSAPPLATSQSQASTEMWVDKYKPASMKTIIGQQGDRSNAKKLAKWLRMWNDNNFGHNKEKAKFNRDDGFAFKAALLSGPPGVGKTTTATLVCQEMGFSYVELNASDSRGKKTLQGGVSEYLDNQSISDMFGKKLKQEGGGRGGQRTGAADDQGYKHCLIMDEVDGVAGNEDRGGIQEMIQMIKATRTPIICICNDRSHPKIRSLVNHCFDLRFQRPRVPQIKAAMMTVAYKEGLKIPPNSLETMIQAANQDVRQVLHNLSMWSAGQKNMNAEQMDKDAKNAQKDLKMGPWDVARQVFSSKDLKTMSFNDKMDLFFHDYSIATLFVQENYLHVVPDKARGDIKKHLDLISRAADSLCQSDLVEKTIRSRMAWRLLPAQAVFASVIPGCTLRGYMGGMINFPSWLGKNSTRGKNFRLLQELQIHMRRRASASIQDLNQTYLPRLRSFLTHPLIADEGERVGASVQLMNDYDLLREDFDSILEVTQYAGFPQPMSKVPPKVKAAFTRAYNKESHMTPYAVDAGGKKKKGRGGGGGGGVPGEESALLGEEGATQEEGSEPEEDDDVSALKVKQKGSAAASAKAKGRGASAKGKGPSKGKAQPKGKGRGRGK